LARYCSEQRRDPLDVPWSVAAPSWTASLEDASLSSSSITCEVPSTRLPPRTEELHPAASCRNGLVGSGVASYECAKNDAAPGFEAAESRGINKCSEGINWEALGNVQRGPPASPPGPEEPQSSGVLNPKDRDAFLREIEKRDDDVDSYFLFLDAGPAVQADHHSALAAVEKDGYALEHAADPLKSDKEIVLAAVTQNGSAFEYAADTLKSNREFVLAAVTQDGFALEYTADHLKSDKEIVQAAVTQNGMSLAYAHESLQRDPGIVLAAVQQNSAALEFAYTNSLLNQDPEFLKACGLWNQKEHTLHRHNEEAIPPKETPLPLVSLEHSHGKAEATQQKYVSPTETPSPLVQVTAELAHLATEQKFFPWEAEATQQTYIPPHEAYFPWEAKATQHKYVPPKETPLPLLQEAAEPAHCKAEATQQRDTLPKETHDPLLQGAADIPHFNTEVIAKMLSTPLLHDASTEQPVHEEGAVNLDVEGEDEGDGAASNEILYISCVLILVYGVIGFLYGRDSAGWSLIDSIYFVAVTVTTVGYGDKTFQGGTDLAKICGGIFVFVGVLIISAAAGVILGALQAQTEARVKRMMAENEKKMLEAGGETPEFNLSAEIRGVFIDVSKGLILVGVALAGGCTGMMYFQEDWSFSDAFYFCCVTMTTVGYGDLVPTNDGAKVFVTVYILFAFGVLASIMSEVGAIPFRIEELRKIDKCLSLLGDSLDSDELAALSTAEEIVKIRNEKQLADAEEDPFVSRAEFAIWQLIKQGKLGMDDVLRCLQTFDKLDVDGSGSLDQDDIDLYLQKEQNSANA